MARVGQVVLAPAGPCTKKASCFLTLHSSFSRPWHSAAVAFRDPHQPECSEPPTDHGPLRAGRDWLTCPPSQHTVPSSPGRASGSHPLLCDLERAPGFSEPRMLEAVGVSQSRWYDLAGWEPGPPSPGTVTVPGDEEPHDSERLFLTGCEVQPVWGLGGLPDLPGGWVGWCQLASGGPALLHAPSTQAPLGPSAPGSGAEGTPMRKL